MKNKNTRIAAVQATPVFLNKKATVEKACELIAIASKKGARLAVFPEAFIPAYPDWVWVVPPSKRELMDELYTELYENAVSIPDEATKKLCNEAKKNNIFVVMGINERNSETSNSSLYNTLLFIDSNGDIKGKHRKLVPTGSERLVWAQGNGSTLNVFDTDFGKLGGLICWENYMPLARYAMYSMGTQIYVASTWDYGDTWLATLRHIAKEGGMFVIGCCIAMRMKDIPNGYEFKKLYAKEKDWINPGDSVIINPKGQFISGPLNKKEEILYADINLNEIPAAKWMLDTAGHYDRPDVFKFEIKRG